MDHKDFLYRKDYFDNKLEARKANYNYTYSVLIVSISCGLTGFICGHNLICKTL